MWSWAKDHWILSTLLALTGLNAIHTATTKAPATKAASNAALDAAIAAPPPQ